MLPGVRTTGRGNTVDERTFQVDPAGSSAAKPFSPVAWASLRVYDVFVLPEDERVCGLIVTKRLEETSGTNRKRSAGCVQKKHLTLEIWLSASCEEDPCYSD